MYEDEKSKFNLGLPGGDTWCVSEAGLYRLALAARKQIHGRTRLADAPTPK